MADHSQMEEETETPALLEKPTVDENVHVDDASDGHGTVGGRLLQMADDSVLERPSGEEKEVTSLVDELIVDDKKFEHEPDGDQNITGGDEEKPQVGMVFKSYEEICEFYNHYAEHMGFGTKTKRSWYNEDGQCVQAVLTCCKEGKGREAPKYRSRVSAKTNCMAGIKVKIMPDELLHLTEVTLEHNHPLCPSKVRFFRSHKKLRLETKTNSEKVVPLKLGKGDAEAMQQYFLHMQSKDSNFFYLMDMDEEGHLRNVFWADARSRAAYKYFGDVIQFDTTYLINKYDMPFAPFVGMNHHGQSVLLGCSILSSENVETYIWLFKALLTCMSGCPPEAIISEHDQFKAVQAAIAEVFPGVRHCLCLWHIMKIIPEKLGEVAECKAIKRTLKKAVYDSLRIDEFEENWKKMIEEYGLEDNEWLTSLYEDRHLWVPVFLKDAFWAGMSMTKRGEKISPFFEGYIQPKTSIKQFLCKYESALQNKHEKEALADFESFHKRPLLISKLHMEEQLSKLYTVDMFKKFQDELKALIYCRVSRIAVDGPLSTFEVKERVYLKDGKKSEHMDFEVIYNENNLEVRCICHFFESRGILCKHALSVLDSQILDEIPSHYILQRWRKDFKRLHALAHFSCDVIPTSPMEPYVNLYKSCLELAEVGMLSEDRGDVVLYLVKEIMKKILMDDYICGETQLKVVYSETKMAESGNLSSQRSGDKNALKVSDGFYSGMPLARGKGRQPPKRLEPSVRKRAKSSKKHQEKCSNQDDVLPLVMATQDFGTHIGTQDSITQMEQFNPTDLSIGNHYGVQVNHQHTQSGMQWNFQHLIQDRVDPTSLSTGSFYGAQVNHPQFGIFQHRDAQRPAEPPGPRIG
ncbi:protein FAR1-RELATED SEQUENCE 6-like isoform X2 [Aristolochia californica]|uniref:protein FAR1-RELATED SEQUENCE 6-like isoform X2 n=1 Tax=Aristolochia californica TaxID=171875 RepID=UPI0035DA8475